jgi:AraC family transcriptional regulator
MTNRSVAPSCADTPEGDPATSAPRRRELVFSGFRLLEARHRPGQTLDAHTHVRPTLLLSLGPAFEERIEGSSLDVGRFDVVWKPGGTTHRNRYPHGARSLVVEFSDAWWADDVSALRGQPWTGRGLPAAVLFTLYRHAFQSADLLGLELEELVTRVLDLIIAADLDSGRAPGRMAHVRDRLRSEITDPPRLAELAEDVDLHPSHLCRAFRRQFGCSMGDYLRRTRIRRALELMSEPTPRSLSTIAFRLGYADQSHFTRDFRRLVGAPPGRFRDSALASSCKDRSRRDA